MIEIFIILYCLLIVDAGLLFICWKQNQVLKHTLETQDEINKIVQEEFQVVIKEMRAEMAENYESKSVKR